MNEWLLFNVRLLYKNRHNLMTETRVLRGWFFRYPLACGLTARVARVGSSGKDGWIMHLHIDLEKCFFFGGCPQVILKKRERKSFVKPFRFDNKLSTSRQATKVKCFLNTCSTRSAVDAHTITQHSQRKLRLWHKVMRWTCRLDYQQCWRERTIPPLHIIYY